MNLPATRARGRLNNSQVATTTANIGNTSPFFPSDIKHVSFQLDNPVRAGFSGSQSFLEGDLLWQCPQFFLAQPATPEVWRLMSAVLQNCDFLSVSGIGHLDLYV